MGGSAVNPVIQGVQALSTMGGLTPPFPVLPETLEPFLLRSRATSSIARPRRRGSRKSFLPAALGRGCPCHDEKPDTRT